MQQENHIPGCVTARTRAVCSSVWREQTQQRRLWNPRWKKWLKVAATYPSSAPSVRKLSALRPRRLRFDPQKAQPELTSWRGRALKCRNVLCCCACGARRRAGMPTEASQWAYNGSSSVESTDTALLINPSLLQQFALLTPKMVRAAQVSSFTRCMSDFPLAASDHSFLPTCGQLHQRQNRL